MADVTQINGATNEAIERDFTPEEKDAFEKIQAEFIARQASDEAKKQADAAALAATNAKLIALGLTQDDINNLLNAAKN